MKTTFIAMALFAVSVSAMGKVQPEKIIGIAVNGYSEEYYAEQAEAWSKEARKHPKSEEAWKNYIKKLKKEVINCIIIAILMKDHPDLLFYHLKLLKFLEFILGVLKRRKIIYAQ